MPTVAFGHEFPLGIWVGRFCGQLDSRFLQAEGELYWGPVVWVRVIRVSSSGRVQQNGEDAVEVSSRGLFKPMFQEDGLA